MFLPLAALVFGLAFSPASARAQEVEDSRLAEARARFALGEAQYAQHNYALAADTFRDVYEMMEGHPNRYLVLFNLGRCLEASGAFRQAAETYRQYLAEGGEAEENAEGLPSRIEELVRRADLAGQAAADAAPAGPTAATPAADDGLVLGGVVTLGVAVAAFAVMGIFGGLALAEDARLSSGCGATASCSPAEVADADTFALVSDVGLGVGGAAAIAGGVMLLVGLSRGGEAGDTAHVVPWATPSGGGLAARVTF